MIHLRDSADDSSREFFYVYCTKEKPNIACFLKYNNDVQVYC